MKLGVTSPADLPANPNLLVFPIGVSISSSKEFGYPVTRLLTFTGDHISPQISLRNGVFQRPSQPPFG